MGMTGVKLGMTGVKLGMTGVKTGKSMWSSFPRGGNSAKFRFSGAPGGRQYGSGGESVWFPLDDGVKLGMTGVKMGMTG